MDTSVAIQLIILLILLILSGFFSSAETALTTVNRMRIRGLADEGSTRAKTVMRITDDTSKMLSAILIGNNVVNLSAASLTTTLAYNLGGSMVAVASAKDVHCTPKMARKLLDDVKPEKLVLAHMGGNEMWDEVEKYLVGQNVYFDTGVILDRMPEEQFLRMVHMHGADRILFGTDSPWADQKKFVTLFDQMPLTEEEKMAVFSGNAKKLLGI